MNLEQVTQPCQRCAEVRRHVIQVNRLLDARLEKLDSWKVVASNFEQEHFAATMLYVTCETCKGTGEVLTEEAQKFLNLLQKFMPPAKGGAA